MEKIDVSEFLPPDQRPALTPEEEARRKKIAEAIENTKFTHNYVFGGFRHLFNKRSKAAS